MPTPHSAPRLAVRAALALAALVAAGAALGAVAVSAGRDTLGPAPRPESGVVALLAGLACLVVVRLAVVLAAHAASAVHAAGRGRPATPRRLAGLDRLVVGVVLGAGALAPQAAGASVAAGPAAVSTASTASTASTDDPVDPTYLRESAPAPTTPSAGRGATPAARPASEPAAPATPRGERHALPSASGGQPSAAQPSTASRHVVVREGDTLWGIAQRALGGAAGDGEVARAVNAIYAANHGVVGADPDHIEVGVRLAVPRSVDGAHR